MVDDRFFMVRIAPRLRLISGDRSRRGHDRGPSHSLDPSRGPCATRDPADHTSHGLRSSSGPIPHSVLPWHHLPGGYSCHVRGPRGDSVPGLFPRDADIVNGRRLMLLQGVQSIGPQLGEGGGTAQEFSSLHL